MGRATLRVYGSFLWCSAAAHGSGRGLESRHLDICVPGSGLATVRTRVHAPTAHAAPRGPHGIAAGGHRRPFSSQGGRKGGAKGQATAGGVSML